MTTVNSSLNTKLRAIRSKQSMIARHCHTTSVSIPLVPNPAQPNPGPRYPTSPRLFFRFISRGLTSHTSAHQALYIHHVRLKCTAGASREDGISCCELLIMICLNLNS
ncbi:hypothetical protein L207DRAFT_348195 [Hyaloscypha variabilis F]|uniref:Uncharacterized protein n=1 Tax=Hyaloscypha variabilis (strain UAMH 11265 / GT02V1 / F) TaxID=1149755 RepID=A0A2J6RR59_HYAVF|nr:hypothetical protein L207DRAFT_348195 [Hyaloscypha variabilis F]